MRIAQSTPDVLAESCILLPLPLEYPLITVGTCRYEALKSQDQLANRLREQNSS